MTIKSLHITGTRAAALGLKEHSLSRLGKYVVLAGKNGSGKSRILRYLRDIVQVVSSQPLGPAVENLRAINVAMANEDNEGSRLYYSGQAKVHQAVVDAHALIEFSGDVGRAMIFSPGPGALMDSESIIPSERRRLAQTLRSDEATQWLLATVPYIAEIQNRWFELTHPRSSVDEVERQAGVSSYQKLSNALTEFFGVELDRDADGVATIFGRPIAHAELSSGQMIAIQLICALHAQAATLGSSILIMDEPETHLHPDALVHLLKSLERLAPSVQVWIATHSIPLLAYINATQVNAIWAVSDGMAEFAGKRPESVIKQLLGDDEGVSHLASFIALPYELASNNYAYQCLLPPESVDTPADDPQLQQIRRALESLRVDGVLRVLDYGAGKGRLLEALGSNGDKVGVDFDYVAFDKFFGDKEYCEGAIARSYENIGQRYFNDADALIELKGEGWANCVVMTNVLHEVPVSEWTTLFSTRGVVSRILGEEGYLLIVEDQQIPVGEMAHQHGFLLMNTLELRKFFCVNHDDITAGRFLSHKDGMGRLTAHLVSKSLFNRVTSESRRAAIDAVRDAALEKIQSLRVAERSYKNGLLHALWTQQLANAILAGESC